MVEGPKEIKREGTLRIKLTGVFEKICKGDERCTV